METNYRNIYKIARNTAGLTQSRWAEMLGISVESVGLYESGRGMPSDDVVASMAEVAGLPVLGYWHLKLKSAVANDLLPDVEVVPLPQAVLKLLEELNDLDEKHVERSLVKIASDGKVSAEESGLFASILSELEDVIEAALAVKFAQLGRIGPEGRAL